MEEDFYCILKLVSGEEILSLIMVDNNDNDPIIILQNPVTITSIMSPSGSSYVKVNPWMELTNDDLFFIRFDKVITMTETKDIKLIQLYQYYISSDITEIYKPYGQVNPSSTLGYISSVNEARKKLESIFKNNV